MRLVFVELGRVVIGRVMAAMLEICRLSEECVEEVYEIERLCFTQPWSKKALEDEAKNPAAVYVVLKEDGRVVGYGGFWSIAGEGHITNVAVHPQFRGRGFGNIIMGAMIDIAEEMGLELLTLEVRGSNRPAFRLYSKYGFKVVGARKNYYTMPTEDAVLMTRYFKSNTESGDMC